MNFIKQKQLFLNTFCFKNNKKCLTLWKFIYSKLFQHLSMKSPTTLKTFLIFTCFNLCFSFQLFAQSGPPIDIHRVQMPIEFDGQVTEAAWDELEPLPLAMNTPNYGNPPSEKVEMYITYDENYLYIGGRMYLSKPEYYRGNTYKRDAQDGTTDFFGFIADSYNDKENGLAFFTTPTAMRWDGVVFNDAQGDMPLSTDWNTFWDAATAKTDYGWSAEMRVPFSSLQFQERDGEVIMGMMFWWYIAAKAEVNAFPNTSTDWGAMNLWKASQFQEFRLTGVKSQRPLYIAPYILGGMEQQQNLNTEETTYVSSNDPTFNVGLDVKYNLTSNLTLDLTANTDFAQVEADDQQVNLTRFSLFFPEKRLFFQERASVFDFSFGQINRLFYSRRIGINDEGEATRILGGARVVGRMGKFDVGLLNMQTAKSEGLNSENFTLLRLRRQVSKTNSYVGGIFTNRMDFEGNYNSNYGVDAILHVTGDEYLTAKWAQSFENTKNNQLFSIDPARIHLNWERRRFDGFSYFLTYNRVGENYAPDMGFELRENYASLDARLAYGKGKVAKSNSKILNWQVFLGATGLQNNTSKATETANINLGGLITTKNNFFALGTLAYRQEIVTDTFSLSDEGIIPTGTYQYADFTSFIQLPYQNLVNGNITIQAGEFFDGNIMSIGLSPFWKISPHLELSGFYQYSRISFKKRAQLVQAHLTRIRFLYMLNTKFSVGAFVQYNDADELFTGNVRVRFNPKEGNDLYIVYNDALNNRRERDWPHLPLSSGRTLVVKYTHTFRLIK